ncbi:hypothetical protein [Bacillus thuringiensis]|uniref:hypothetical protein n=1 Tax=Bacillus thuringiensis TaxID=1428 RepID=UPI00234E3B11|nr:hypothetical protein [Bacillus thuringiensis]MDC7735519.1 hypothetical protein [Bacillus thuringiensis]HDR8197990.1 hypothetical protein [Bacillus thuringiensis]
MNLNDFLTLVKFFIELLPAGAITEFFSGFIAVLAVIVGLCCTYLYVVSLILDNNKKRLENQLLKQKLNQSKNKTAGTNPPKNGPGTTH